jgi:two-component system, NarL family, response regulator LiaR
MKKREDLNITPRQLEVLELIAKSMSTREIAEKLFVSQNTVKTHSSRRLRQAGSKTAHAGRSAWQGIRTHPLTA